MKFKLFLIITALLASYPVNTFAEESEDDIIEFTDEIFSVEFTDAGSYEDEAQLFGDTIPWDGTTLAEVIPEEGVYHIYNGAQLAWIAEQVNTPDSGGMVDCVISIEADIDLADYNWIPIGCSYDTPFAGTLIGNGYTVSNLNFDASSYTHCGLFGCVIGTVSNLTVHSSNITTSRCLTPSASDPSKNGIGILAGSLDARRFDYNHKDYVGVIEDCTVRNSLTVNNNYGETFYIGGIVGVNNGGELYRNISYADVTAQSNPETTHGADEAYVGGIAGYNAGLISGYLDTGNYRAVATSGRLYVTAANPSVGMVAGGNSGTVSYYNDSQDWKGVFLTKQPSAFEDNYGNIGCIVGKNSGLIERCASSTNLIVTEVSTDGDSPQINKGGIAGLNIGEVTDDGEIISEAIITDCSGMPSLGGCDSYSNIGGIAGMSANAASIITDCSSSSRHFLGGVNRINAGGIVGVTYGPVDSCINYADISISTSVSSSLGGIAGISYNTISDCISSNNTIELSSDSPMAVLYSGGIAGESYGRIRRCSTNDTISASGSLAYAGGIAGRAELNDDKSIITGDGEGLISKCTSNADISCTNVAGGIVGDANNATIQRCYSNSDISDAVGAGGVTGRAASTDIENCMVEGTISAITSTGASYEFTNSDNTINMSYFAPTLSGNSNHAISIADTARYITQRSYLNTDVTNTDTVEGITAVTNETATLRSTFDELNFDSIWAMNDGILSLQHTVNSNALNRIGEITETRMHFNVSLENPQVGQRVYIALYDVNDRFCGTVSTVCSKENINSTGTRADFPLEYSYDYYDYETWEPAKGLPFSYKAFTWDEETGMKSLSSVEEGILTYYFE